MYDEILISKNSLPSSNRVEPEKIAKMLDDNSASYKFYWFFSIINKCIEEPNTFRFSIRDLCMDMLYYAYWSVNECHLYLGFGDVLEKMCKDIYQIQKIKTNISKKDFFNFLSKEGVYHKVEDIVYKIIKNNVIFRLLKPFYIGFFDGDPNYEKINNVVKVNNVKLPYVFTNENSNIELDEDYAIYFVKHAEIISDFIKYKLADYLQKKNLSVPGIINKLEVPREREGLASQRNMYKAIYEVSNNMYIDINIYNDSKIKENILQGDYELDHFIPHSFCCHNEWWNLTPTTRDINGGSVKSNKIPLIDKYLSRLAKQQYNIYKEIHSNNTLYQKFMTLNGDTKFVIDKEMSEIYRRNNITEEQFSNALNGIISTMADVALRQGFEIWQ